MRRPRVKLPSVTARQFAAILAALRVCQHSSSNDALAGVMREWYQEKPLGADDIDTLCERLNCGEAKQ